MARPQRCSVIISQGHRDRALLYFLRDYAGLSVNADPGTDHLDAIPARKLHPFLHIP